MSRGPVERARSRALALTGAHEVETRGRVTSRVGDTIFAALHDELLILRSPRDEQEARLADRGFRPAPYWGVSPGWQSSSTASVRMRSWPGCSRTHGGLRNEAWPRERSDRWSG